MTSMINMDAALDRLAQDQCVAYPTETVWGLAARASSAAGIDMLRTWKGRADAHPISILIASPASLEGHGFAIDSVAKSLIDAFWPGPLTLVLASTSTWPRGVSDSKGGVGVRCSSHPLAASLAAAAEARGLGPVTATSLNRSGEAAARNAAQATQLCSTIGLSSRDESSQPLMIDPGRDDAAGEPPSSVLDLSGPRPRLLRTGALGRTALSAVLGKNFD